MVMPRRHRDGSRAVAALLAMALHIALLLGLMATLAPHTWHQARSSALVAINLIDRVYIKPPPPQPLRRPHAATGVATMPASHQPDVAPSPVSVPSVKIVPGNASPAPPAMATGASPGAGAAAAAAGQGFGDGAGDRPGTGPTKINGEIREADYPAAGRALRIGHAVLVVFTIGTDGRAHGCTVREPSPDPDADALTCRLVEARFRFRPATNAAGSPISMTYGWRQKWFY